MKQSVVKYSHKLIIHSEFIRSNLVENPILVKLFDLRKRLMSYMQSMGLTEILELTKQHFQETRKKNLVTYCSWKMLWTIKSSLFF